MGERHGDTTSRTRLPQARVYRGISQELSYAGEAKLIVSLEAAREHH
jgi:hypothetical protein